ncbi:hypothetical protein XELAEV_18025140mg [Xenopus laevis]|uniref:Uncharacterized protein n=1 Tax=Xenopus laevis TaxID=8355 RepID=A0A974D1D7_XENLA|nr:hypothetical protein XELAEV_18025140mg [Xenopus laevis]
MVLIDALEAEYGSASAQIFLRYKRFAKFKNNCKCTFMFGCLIQGKEVTKCYTIRKQYVFKWKQTLICRALHTLYSLILVLLETS